MFDEIAERLKRGRGIIPGDSQWWNIARELLENFWCEECSPEQVRELERLIVEGQTVDYIP